MRKLLLLTASTLFLFSCNRSAEPKPDADRVIKDTLAQTILRPFNENPHARQLHAKVNSKSESFLRQRDAAIKKLMAEMNTKPQHFSIEAGQRAQITGEKGTHISFNPNSFINKEGHDVSAPIDVELKEYYAVDQALKDQVTTTDGSRLLDSKGIISVNATSGGEQVMLKQGKRVDVEFPFSLSGKDKYKFFYGNREVDGAVNWLPAQSYANSFNEAKEFAKPVFSYHGLNLQNYLLSAIKYPDEAKRNELSARIEASFYVNTDGNITDITTSESYKVFRTEILRVLNDMPAWKPALYNGHSVPSMEHVTIDFNIRRTDQVTVDFNEAEVTLVDVANYSTANNKNLALRSFDRLGWYNCGQEIQVKGTKADLIVRADSKSEIRVIIKNRNVVLSGENCVGYSRFKNLPVNAEVYVVAVRAEGDNIFYAVQPLKLEKQNVVSLTWKKGVEEDVYKAYRKLNIKV